MSDVSGPISTLPGSAHAPRGACDEHPDRPATCRIQGETDSFGAEFFDLCDECAAAMRAEIKAERDRPRICEWCKSMATDVRPQRDFEEGLCGRVYDVCGACRKRQNDLLNEEWEEAHGSDER
jgi:hypothetical protein